MYGHGFGMLFLASVYGEEDDDEAPQGARKDPDQGRQVLAARPRPPRAAGATSPATDGGDFDEGSTTITQMQGLRAARNAGIVVPKSIIDKAHSSTSRNARPAAAA